MAGILKTSRPRRKRIKFNPRHLPVPMSVANDYLFCDWITIIYGRPDLQLQVINNYIERTGNLPQKVPFRGAENES